MSPTVLNLSTCPIFGVHFRGLDTKKIHLAVDAQGMLVRAIITQGSRADYTLASRLIEGISADY